MLEEDRLAVVADVANEPWLHPSIQRTQLVEDRVERRLREEVIHHEMGAGPVLLGKHALGSHIGGERATNLLQRRVIWTCQERVSSSVERQLAREPPGGFVYFFTLKSSTAARLAASPTRTPPIMRAISSTRSALLSLRTLLVVRPFVSVLPTTY